MDQRLCKYLDNNGASQGYMSCQESPTISVEGLLNNKSNTEESKTEMERGAILMKLFEYLVCLVAQIRSPLDFQLSDLINNNNHNNTQVIIIIVVVI